MFRLIFYGRPGILISRNLRSHLMHLLPGFAPMHLMPGIAHFDAFTASLHNFVVHLYLYFLVLNVVFFWLIDKLKAFCDPWGEGGGGGDSEAGPTRSSFMDIAARTVAASWPVQLSITVTVMWAGHIYCVSNIHVCLPCASLHIEIEHQYTNWLLCCNSLWGLESSTMELLYVLWRSL